MVYFIIFGPHTEVVRHRPAVKILTKKWQKCWKREDDEEGEKEGQDKNVKEEDEVDEGGEEECDKVGGEEGRGGGGGGGEGEGGRIKWLKI